MNILFFHNSHSSDCYPVLIVSSIDFTPQESQYFTAQVAEEQGVLLCLLYSTHKFWGYFLVG